MGLFTNSVQIQILFVCYYLIFVSNHQTNAKTYYFKSNKTTNSNEFKIYNRIQIQNENLNSNQSTDIIKSRTKVYMASSYYYPAKHLFNKHYNQLLDPDWNYDWTKINRTNHPVYIDQMYESINREFRKRVFNHEPITRILFNGQDQPTNIIRFNLNSLDSDENLSDIELHFYMTVNQTCELYRQSIVLRLYQVENGTTIQDDNPDVHRLLNVIYIFQTESGWQVFKIRKSLNNFINDSSNENLDLFITVAKPNNNTIDHIFEDLNEDVLRTFLIINSKKAEEDYRNINYNNAAGIPRNASCRKHNWYIDFAMLGLNEIILAPHGYMAYKCLGKCHRSNNNRLLMANHAKMLNILPSAHTTNICCVPSRYFPLPIMFYDKHGTIVIKIYQNMVVAECGCR